MAEVLSCPRCQADVPADAPDGLCPECLFRQAIDGQHEEEQRDEMKRSPAVRFVPPAPAELARHFPQLEVLELLGQGGMGSVYKARQTKLDRLVALKILPPEVARNPAFAERFTREARSLARLNHPHIVTVYDYGDVDGLYYFTMEYVDGQNLRDLLQSAPLPAAEALAIVPQVCDALQYAHDEGLVHRDIKPENILLDRKGRVKIADFGLARLVGLTPTYLTLTGTHEVMGTLLYMAPEQMKRSHTVDHRADLYSLGVVLYEMVTGELPLGRFAPPSHKAAVPERLDQVVLRALAREPAERYQDAAAFKQDVESALKAATGPLGPRPPSHRKPAWPSAGFEILTQNGNVAVRGLIRRDDEALILEFEFVKQNLWKKFKAFCQEPDRPQEVRIPLHEIASISYGWGWGKPPRSLILTVTRLVTLAGLPGSQQGKVQLSIPHPDREGARRLVESLGLNPAEGGAPGSAGVFFDRRQAQREIGSAGAGLVVTGVVTLLSWALIFLVLIGSGLIDWWTEAAHGGRVSYWWLLVGLPSILITVVSGVLVAGGVMMMRLRGYPLAATAAILAMIPWSPGWLIGLPFGIWACIILGRPEVAEGFLNDNRPANSEPGGGRRRIASRFLSLVRSVGRYILPTMPGRKPPGGSTSSTPTTPPS